MHLGNLLGQITEQLPGRIHNTGLFVPLCQLSFQETNCIGNVWIFLLQMGMCAVCMQPRLKFHLAPGIPIANLPFGNLCHTVSTSRQPRRSLQPDFHQSQSRIAKWFARWHQRRCFWQRWTWWSTDTAAGTRRVSRKFQVFLAGLKVFMHLEDLFNL